MLFSDDRLIGVLWSGDTVNAVSSHCYCHTAEKRLAFGADGFYLGPELHTSLHHTHTTGCYDNRTLVCGLVEAYRNNAKI